jgi:hypothetical protein
MKLHLETLKFIQFAFQIQSDFSTKCNGYYALCAHIESAEKELAQETPIVIKPFIVAPPPPQPPLSRMEREGSTKCCIRCGSSVVRSGFLGIFGEYKCINPKCINSQTRKIYR